MHVPACGSSYVFANVRPGVGVGVNLRRLQVAHDGRYQSPKSGHRATHHGKLRTSENAPFTRLSRCILEMKYEAFNLEIARSVLDQLQHSSADPVGGMFPVLKGCLFSTLNDHKEDAAHSIMRDRATFGVLKSQKLPEQLELAEDTYGMSPLDALA